MNLKKKAVLYPLSVAKRMSARNEIRRYLKRRGHKMLNVGAQTNAVKDWLNVDLFPFPGTTFMDATKPWPLPDAAFDAILCEHMIEHVSKEEGRFVLKEAYRVAKRGAPIRVVTPDLRAFARLALDPGEPEAQIYVHFIQGRFPHMSPHDIVNNNFYGYGHRYIYSSEELTKALQEAGFDSVTESRGGFPNHPVFTDIEGHPKIVGIKPNAFEAFALEAIKN
jgi:predicted SAM-dependent methyltransferase